MATLADIRAKLTAAQNKSNDNSSRRSTDDLASYPFWNTPVGGTSTIRFLPDGDAENTFFWRNRDIVTLPFEGVTGGEFPTNQPVTVRFTSPSTFGMKCPAATAVQHLWKGSEEDKQIARTYYRKRSWIMQGFVVNSAFEEAQVPENPIRRFVVNKSLFDLVEQILVDPDIEDLVTDFTAGRDFRIMKTQKGEWANYASSKFAAKARSLSDEERAAIDKFGLHNLGEFLGKTPTDEDIEAMKGMVQDSLDGLPFDAAKYPGFKAFGAKGDTPAQNSAPAAETSSVPAAPPNASDVLERIRLRTARG